MSVPQHYQAIVIGSGQGGTPLCGALATAGMRTALIEKVHVGGTCINEGCTPTKTMVASARVAYLTRRGEDYGVESANLRMHMDRVRQRKRDVVDKFRNGSQAKLEKTANFELIFGEATFSGPKSLSVRTKDGATRDFSADKIFINAGCRPGEPPIEGLRTIPFLNSTSIMELDTVPEHLLVLGGGYVGLEFGQMFRRFGSRVTIVQSGAQLLSQEDADIAAAIADILKQDGIEVLLNTKAERVAMFNSRISLTVRERSQSDAKTAPYHRAAGQTRALEGSHLLVATGRPPNTEALNLAAAKIATDKRGFIQVNYKLETTAEGIYALGDIKGGPAFTHISYDDFRVLRTNIIEKGRANIDGRQLPYTVFIDPQLGRIGLSESEAKKQNKKFRVAKMPMSAVARAIELDETRGFLKALVEDKTDQILGAAVLGIEGGEIMSIIQVAMLGQLPYSKLRDGIFAHPTLAESLNNLFTRFER
jgi:pyruvate/2-oxoglutarate dehydrogenase complex dihydrolipoamide dehydrogenase (E3) component